jgi:hypothetical protein
VPGAIERNRIDDENYQELLFKRLKELDEKARLKEL